MNGKYKECIELCNEMTAKLSHKRPDCEEIHKRKNSWALNEEEFKINEKLKKIIDLKESENELTIYSMLRSKMISDKAIKSKSKRVHNCVVN